ncbi:hypothetical protein HK096_003579 [Nowakowskiella sp. JEL0078]|nr:hypothetical protein HK096_003579 [Nowakowskiella sp. JEL0078]
MPAQHDHLSIDSVLTPDAVSCELLTAEPSISMQQLSISIVKSTESCNSENIETTESERETHKRILSVSDTDSIALSPSCKQKHKVFVTSPKSIHDGPPSESDSDATVFLSESVELDGNVLPPTSLSILHSISEEKGYRNQFNEQKQIIRMPIHSMMEDYCYPIEDMSTATCGAKIYIMADGHGGANASRFFVNRARELITEFIDSFLATNSSVVSNITPLCPILRKSVDFSDSKIKISFKRELDMLYLQMDAEYCAKKVEEYRKWLDVGSPVGLRPVDDGCTMVINIFVDGWMINCNVGDSRTVVAKRDVSLTDQCHIGAIAESGLSHVAQQKQSDFSIIFTSSDHNMTHPEKIYGIHRTGGQFVNPNGTIKHVNVTPPSNRNNLPYHELVGSRIYRPLNEAIRRVGVSHKRTLNLTATMGDLLFKVEPAVLNCRPDITFVNLSDDLACSEYIVVMATDGVWDHLRVRDQDFQVLKYVYGVLDGTPNSAIDDDSNSDNSEVEDEISCMEIDEESVEIEDEELFDVEGKLVEGQRRPSSRSLLTKRSNSTGSYQSAGLTQKKLQRRLKRATEGLVRREVTGTGRPNTGLFAERQIRYDDATALVMLIH